MKELPRVLVIAGTDSSGGAGLIRDVQVISDFGARAAGVITAVTAQTHRELDATCLLPVEIVRQQLRAALRCAPVSAMKIGMLGSGAIVREVLEALPDRAQIPSIVDPVLSSSSGAALLDDEGVVLLREQLFARSTLITPNLIEAARLLGCEVAGDATAQFNQAAALLRFGSQGVLLKGGHGSDSDAVDVLATQSGSPVSLHARRISASMRGTGCALSSAIAALLVAGASLESACRQAKAYVHKELQAAAL
ncbi:MAG: hydroxymethylpyrimidine/phosphomethylpyrimidine kinase [Pseudomonadota bacterium]|nr:hydroxymethylpyrimidine/phosphomethylpyrimidine kinase [Pseudomonadota bacterium]